MYVHACMCVCACVCECMCIYGYIHWKNVWICWQLCVCPMPRRRGWRTKILIDRCVCAYVYVCIRVFSYVCVCAHVCVSVCVYTVTTTQKNLDFFCVRRQNIYQNVYSISNLFNYLFIGHELCNVLLKNKWILRSFSQMLYYRSLFKKNCAHCIVFIFFPKKKCLFVLMSLCLNTYNNISLHTINIRVR